MVPGGAAAAALWLIPGKAAVSWSFGRVCGSTGVHPAQRHLWDPSLPGDGQAGKHHQPFSRPSGLSQPGATMTSELCWAQVNLSVLAFSALQRDSFKLLSEDDPAEHNGPHPLWVSETGMFLLAQRDHFRWNSSSYWPDHEVLKRGSSEGDTADDCSTSSAKNQET